MSDKQLLAVLLAFIAFDHFVGGTCSETKPTTFRLGVTIITNAIIEVPFGQSAHATNSGFVRVLYYMGGNQYK